MNSWMPVVALTLFAGSTTELATRYTAGRSALVETETRFELETIDMTVTVDGEERDGSAAGRSAHETRRVVHRDEWLEAQDGVPTKVRRSFTEVSVAGATSFRDQERSSERDGPLVDTVLELTAIDGEIEIEVVEGVTPEQDAVLSGHHLALALDALLPYSEVEEGDEWELDADTIRRALGADLDSAYFPQPARDEGEDESGERGRRRGRRGGSMSLAQLLRAGECEAQATLQDGAAEYRELTCIEIAIELKCSGELPEPERSERGGRALSSPTAALVASFELEAEGTLYFSAEDGLPLGFELEGDVTILSERTRNRGESEITMTSTQEGSFTHRVEITRAEDAEEE